MRFRNRPQSGFTLLELIVVVAVAAVLVSLAAPSFREFFAKRRVEGVASELNTDLQYARSEAVARNAVVRITFGTNCYVIHLDSATASCDQTSKSISPASAEIKTVQLDAGSSVTLSPQGGITFIAFDPVRGTPGVASAVDANSSVGGSWQVRSAMSLAGRVSTCSPNGSIKGYATSC